MADYPYKAEPGNVTVIGPECFASDDESVISWQGQNYYEQRSLWRRFWDWRAACRATRGYGFVREAHEARKRGKRLG